jgi:hypothetical protein
MPIETIKEIKMKRFMGYRINEDGIFVSDDAKYALYEVMDLLDSNENIDRVRTIIRNLIKASGENTEREVGLDWVKELNEIKPLRSKPEK